MKIIRLIFKTPALGFEHVTEYRPLATASGPYSVTCSNPRFGDKYNAYDVNVIYLISPK